MTIQNTNNFHKKVLVVCLAFILGILTIFSTGNIFLNITNAGNSDVTLPGTEINAALKKLVYDAENPQSASVVIDERQIVEMAVADDSIVPEPDISETEGVSAETLPDAITEDITVSSSEEGIIPAEVVEEPVVLNYEAISYVQYLIDSLPLLMDNDIYYSVYDQYTEIQNAAAGLTPEEYTLVDFTNYNESVSAYNVYVPVQDPEITESSEEVLNEGETAGENVLPEQEEVQEQPEVVFTYEDADYSIQKIEWSAYAPVEGAKTVPLSYAGKLVAWYVPASEQLAVDQAAGVDTFVAYDDNGNAVTINRDYYNTVYLYYYAESLDDVIYFNADMSHAFQNMRSLIGVSGLKYIRTDSVENMSYMFADDERLSDIRALQSFKTDRLTDVSYMFINCVNLPTTRDILDTNTYDLCLAESQERSEDYLALVNRYGTFSSAPYTEITYEMLADEVKDAYPAPYTAWGASYLYADATYSNTPNSLDYPDWFYNYMGWELPQEPEVEELPMEYAVSIISEGNGFAYTANEDGAEISEPYHAGDTVRIAMVAGENNKIQSAHVYADETELACEVLSDTSFSFQMPETNVTVNVVFEEIESENSEEAVEETNNTEELTEVPAEEQVTEKAVIEDVQEIEDVVVDDVQDNTADQDVETEITDETQENDVVINEQAEVNTEDNNETAEETSDNTEETEEKDEEDLESNEITEETDEMNVDEAVILTPQEELVALYKSNTAESHEDEMSGVDFSSMRLLVIAENPEVFLDQAAIISEYNGVYLLQFESDDVVRAAYAYFLEHAVHVEADAAIYVASENDEGENQANNENENIPGDVVDPFAELQSELNIAEKQAIYDIALIDTGAPSIDNQNIVAAVSMIDDDPLDYNGHGTEMVKYITEENSDAKILSIKAFDQSGISNMSAVYAAIEYAMEQDVKIINLSASALVNAENSIIAEAIRRASEKGIVVVGAAGNNGINAKYCIPGSVAEAYIIGSCDAEGVRRSLSNFGETVDYNFVSATTSEAAARFAGWLACHTLADIDRAVHDGVFFEPDYNPNDEVRIQRLLEDFRAFMETDPAKEDIEEYVNEMIVSDAQALYSVLEDSDLMVLMTKFYFAEERSEEDEGGLAFNEEIERCKKEIATLFHANDFTIASTPNSSLVAITYTGLDGITGVKHGSNADYRWTAGIYGVVTDHGTFGAFCAQASSPSPAERVSQATWVPNDMKTMLYLVSPMGPLYGEYNFNNSITADVYVNGFDADVPVKGKDYCICHCMVSGLYGNDYGPFNTQHVNELWRCANDIYSKFQQNSRWMEVYNNATSYFAYYTNAVHGEELQDLFWVETDSVGSLQVKKQSANPTKTDGISFYSLANAVYEVYLNSSCTDIVPNATLTTNASGESNIVKLPVGTYYVKEKTPSQGYNLDTAVYPATVSFGYTKVVTSREPPQDVGANLTVSKTLTNNNGSIRVDCVASGDGAAQDANREYTYTLKVTNASGTVQSTNYPCSGNWTSAVSGNNGTFKLKSGQSVVISGIPQGYKYTITQSISGDVGSYYSTWASNNGARQTKINTVSGTIPSNPSTNPSFTIQVDFGNSNTYSYTGSKSGSITSGGSVSLASGQSITIQDVQVGTRYTVVEVNPSAGNNGTYTVSGAPASGTINIDNSKNVVAVKNTFTPKTQTALFENRIKPSYAGVQKVSANTRITSGDSFYSLSGAQYGVYNSYHDAEIQANPLAIITTNATGKGTTTVKINPFTTYYMREVSASPGYKISNEIVSITANPGQTVTKTMQEEPYGKTKVTVKKIVAGTTDKRLTTAEFTLYEFSLAQGQKYVETGKLTPNVNIRGANEDGMYSWTSYIYASDDNPEGRFIVDETKLPNKCAAIYAVESDATGEIVPWSSGVQTISSNATSLVVNFTAENYLTEIEARMYKYGPTTPSVVMSDTSFVLYAFDEFAQDWDTAHPINMVWQEDPEDQYGGYYKADIQWNIQNLGRFMWKETNAQSGYEIADPDSGTFTLSLSEFASDFYVIKKPVNNAETVYNGTLTLTKYKSGSRLSNRVPVNKDGVFRVYAWNPETEEYDKYVQQLQYDDVTGTYQSPSNLVAYINPQSINYNEGKFRVVEEKAPSGLIKGEPWHADFAITSRNKNVVQSISGSSLNPTNAVNKYQIEKYITGTTVQLKGVRFEFSKGTQKELLTTGDNTTGLIRSTMGFSYYISNGVIYLEEIEPGTYSFREVEAPEEYAVDTTTYIFKVGQDGLITQDGVTQASHTKVLYNTPSIKLHITKTEPVATQNTVGRSSAEAGFPAGTEFAVYEWIQDEEDYSSTVYANIVYNGHEFVDKKTGEYALLQYDPDVNQGKFQIKETKAGEGYIQSDAVFEVQFSIQNNGKIAYTVKEDGTQTASGTYSRYVDLKFQNTPNQFTIKKTDETGRVLGGGEFEVKNLTTGETMSNTTDASGLYHLYRLKPGTYQVTEKTAPTGYLKDEKAYKFKVLNNGKLQIINENNVVAVDENGNTAEGENLAITVTVKNTIPYKLRVTKQDSTNGSYYETNTKFPAGTVFELYEWSEKAAAESQDGNGYVFKTYLIYKDDYSN